MAITAIFRDEARFLKEWIEYHRLIGVEHFYLTNHKSTDDYETVLAPYIASGIVELRHETQDTNENKLYRHQNKNVVLAWNRLQMSAYHWALQKAKNETKWLIVIDTDEFVVPKNGETLAGILDGFQNEAAIAINWQMFGSSHVARIPDGKLMIETLMLRGPRDLTENRLFKMIVRPNRINYFIGPHQCVFNGNDRIVDMAGHPVTPHQNLTQEVEIDRAQINHYWSRDEEFYQNVKLTRTKKMGGMSPYLQKRLELFNQEPDDAIVPYIAPLRQKMGLTQ